MQLWAGSANYLAQCEANQISSKMQPHHVILTFAHLLVLCGAKNGIPISRASSDFDHFTFTTRKLHHYRTPFEHGVNDMSHATDQSGDRSGPVTTPALPTKPVALHVKLVDLKTWLN